MLKKIKLIPLLSLTFVLSLCLLSACDDNEDDAGAEVVLNSFGPSGVKQGEKIKFIGRNLNKVTSIVFTPGIEIPSGSFASQSSTLIEVIVPSLTERGKVVLKSPDGDLESKSVLDLEVPVVISSITAEAKPGTDITITAENANWIEEIVFAEDVVVEKADFKSRSENEVVVTVPVTAQSGFLVFLTGGTEPLTIESEESFTVTVPTVTSIAPASAKHTDNVTITGTDLDQIISITFGGNVNATQFVSQSATEIVVAVPVGALNGKLTLNQASPVTVVSTDALSVILPKATAISPKPAIPGTDNITITGTNLDLVAELTLVGVTDPILAADFVSHSATKIELELPAAAVNGAVNYKSVHGYSSSLGVSVLIPTPGPSPLPISIYDDSFGFGGGDWSWNVGTSLTSITDPVYSGTKAWQFTTPTDGGASVGGLSGLDASGMTHFSFSLNGGAGTNGKNIAVILNDNWGNYNAVTLVEGQWKEYKVLLSAFPDVNKSSITRITFKVEGMAGSTIYLDRIGFE